MKLPCGWRCPLHKARGARVWLASHHCESDRRVVGVEVCIM